MSTISDIFPPLAPIVDQILAGMAQTSTTATIIGLVVAGWGTSRMFASLASAVVQLETTSRRRSFVRTTVRRIGSILVVAGILLLSLVLSPILGVLRDRAGDQSVGTTVLGIVAVALPILLTTLALGVVYRVTPIVRPSWRAIAVPAVIGAVALDILSRGFVFFAPRIFAGNVVYGTLGAILVGLVWLQLVFMIILIGAAWTIERTLAASGAVTPVPANDDRGAPPPV